ncbi:MAG: hypothetical protein Phog2KO_07680 [Phototrophicaceae bacterium]
MQWSRTILKSMIVLSIAIIMVACSPTEDNSTEAIDNDTEVDSQTSTEIPVEATSEVSEVSEEVVTETVTEAVSNVSPDSQRVLAWVSSATRPGNQSASNPGELVYFNSDGSSETALALPQGTTRVTQCGPYSTSPDGNTFAFIVTTGGGNEFGTLYLSKNGSPELTSIADGLNPASCFGSTPFQFSADGSQFAFIEWSGDATSEASPTGFLKIYDTESASEITRIETVTTFDFTSNGATWINFFNNGNNQATEVSITTWDGSSETEISSFVADEENDCYYNSASISEISDNLVAIMGYRCSRGEVTSTQWQLFNISPDNQTAQLEQSDVTGGRYFVFSQTNALFPSTDGSQVFFTIPDGINSQSVGLYTTALDGNDASQLIERSGLMPSVSDLPYDDNNATAILAPNGQYLAIVVNSPDNDAILNVFDLSDPSLPPITLDSGERGDTIGAMVFNNASDTLYYVAGSDEGGNNSLFALNLNTGAESRISRGRYAQMSISPDDSSLAIMNWVEFDADEPLYLTLETIDIASNETSVIYVGGEIDDEGKLINESFAYPLAWHQG